MRSHSLFTTLYNRMHRRTLSNMTPCDLAAQSLQSTTLFNPVSSISPEVCDKSEPISRAYDTSHNGFLRVVTQVSTNSLVVLCTL